MVWKKYTWIQLEPPIPRKKRRRYCMTDAIQELRESMTQALRDVLEDLDRQIDTFGDEEERDWIFEGMVADAVMFLASLPPLLPIPTVTIADDAEIIFEWNISNSRRAYVGLEGEGDFRIHLNGVTRIVLDSMRDVLVKNSLKIFKNISKDNVYYD